MAIIAIGQQTGSRGVELGQLAATRLGYKFVGGGELVEEASRRFGVTREQLQVFDERQPHFWERFRTDHERLFAVLRAVVLKEMAADRVVVVGRSLVPMILPAGTIGAMRVRAVGMPAARVSQVADEEKLDRPAAERRVRDSDREMRARAQTLLGLDIEDPSHYSLVLNTSVLSLETLADALASCARQLDAAGGIDATHSMRDLALSAQVRATLLSHPKIGHAHIDVQCARGVVTLSGAGLVPPWDSLVQGVVSQLEGVTSIEIALEQPPIPPAA
jgi:cytidylate kinase